MAELRGGTTIAGYTALHSGLQNPYLGGSLTISGSLNVGGTQFSSNGDNSLRMTTNSGYIEIGPKNSTYAHIYTDRGHFYMNKDILISGKQVWHTGTLPNPLQTTDAYMSLDTSGSTSYPRLVPKNAGSSPNWVRVYSTDTGILPYSNGTSSLGTSSWKFRDIHAVDFYENGTALSSKYAAAGHNHNSTYLNRSGDTFSGDLVSTTRSSGIYGSYDSSKVDHIWSMGTGYKVHSAGTDFGTLYGMAYKHTNNTAGGTMAGGHQIVFASAGVPRASIGLGGGFWTTGDINARHVIATTDLSGHTLYERGTELSNRYVTKSGNSTVSGDLAVTKISAGSAEVDGPVSAEYITVNDPAANYSTSFQQPSIRIVTVNDAPNIGFYTGATNMGRVGFLESPTNVLKVENSVGDRVELRMNNNYVSFYTVESFYHRVMNFGGAGVMKVLNGSIKSFQFRDGADANYIELQASNFKVGSMRAYKKNIKKLSGGNRNKVRQTPIFEYNLREQEEKEKKMMGLVFEEAPEELKGEDTIDLYSMITMLWGAVQELDEELESLKKNKKAIDK